MQKSAQLNIQLNTRDVNEDTAFHMACENGHSKIAEMFVEKSAELHIELNAKNAGGWTPFHLACEKGHNVEFHYKCYLELYTSVRAVPGGLA